MAFLLLLFVSLVFVNVTYGASNCGTFSENTLTLGLKFSNSGDDALFGRVLVGKTWSDWEYLWSSTCDNYESGNWDYFDDFADKTEAWDAVALYECGSDGITIETMTYWDGTSSSNTIEYWCDNVAGPMVDCYEGEVAEADRTGLCYKGWQSGSYYERVWLDQSGNGNCPGMNVKLGEVLQGDSTTNVGKLFFKSNPGLPDCSYKTVKRAKVNKTSAMAVLQRPSMYST
eukprot:894765_1